ncbi:hypothetical protein BC939DRAFT_530175 [Gamsiella multidivaricata]|uniref:uncharacterized protein n=1 Tax=Gamsiella multidivaricata TaxID=101098 RepID=UPI002220BF0B|nr:uncharacterized protein BC939DRAFT_530175 [Gamsiella multidivaricata]KAG0359151.1 hypothetical protein BGZ54_010086 [Gamsiella multidivaricata]KAI7821249.1 hypothetical protein BC939DRAFT_530175 [Gamsiella multidivaricata]
MRIAASMMVMLALVVSTAVAGSHHKKHHRNSKKKDAIIIDKKVFNTANLPFIPHNGTALFTNWVGLNVDYQYIQPIFNLVNSTASLSNGTLLSRGESHITVILPPEYDNILHPAGVTIEELNALATADNRLQRARFGIECLGRVQAVSEPDKVFQQAVQIILKNYREVVAYREEVFGLFVRKGGNPALFDPNNFLLHITLGFRRRNLFVEDGVFKGKNACIHKMVAR